MSAQQVRVVLRLVDPLLDNLCGFILIHGTGRQHNVTMTMLTTTHLERLRCLGYLEKQSWKVQLKVQIEQSLWIWTASASACVGGGVDSFPKQWHHIGSATDHMKASAMVSSSDAAACAVAFVAQGTSAFVVSAGENLGRAGSFTKYMSSIESGSPRDVVSPIYPILSGAKSLLFAHFILQSSHCFCKYSSSRPSWAALTRRLRASNQLRFKVTGNKQIK